MKRKQYVKIKKVNGSRYWYTDKIGEIFKVSREYNSDYEVYNGNIHACLVAKGDAELIVTEERPAKKGEKVLVTTPPTYEEAEVVGTFSSSPIERDYSGVFARVVLGKRSEYLSDEQYEVIINNEVKNEEANGMKIDLNAMGYDELIAHGEAVLTAIQLRSYSEGYEQGRFDAEMDMTYMPPQEKTAQERRDEIVEQAKADIENLRYWAFCVTRYDINVEFVVNKEKRTVVALLKSIREGKVISKGIAKAAPDDCFNVHIGEAIALYRALGLEVPDEYLNAPQPTEVRVGDVIAYRGLSKTTEYAIVVADEESTGSGRVALSSIAATKSLVRVTDDSRMEVGE